MNPEQTRSLVAICLMAAFADGHQNAEEREHVRKVAESLSREAEVDFVALYQAVLLGRVELEAVARPTARSRRPKAPFSSVCPRRWAWTASSHAAASSRPKRSLRLRPRACSRAMSPCPQRRLKRAHPPRPTKPSSSA